MDITKIMGDLYRHANTLPESKNRWLIELAANALEHTHLEVLGDRETVLQHVVEEELSINTTTRDDQPCDPPIKENHDNQRT